jgi:prepilin-type processing-associated H-X9-DG protein
MEMDLRALGAKYPGHTFTMDGNVLLCDGHTVTTIKPDVPAEKIVESGTKMTEKELIERIVEFSVRLMEDPHYYDYDVVQKRKQCQKSSDT